MAKRYDQDTKDEVVNFVREFNEENGRGGQSAAVKKWDLNPITVKAWLEKAGVSTPGKSSRKKKKGAAKAKASSTASSAKRSSKSVDGVEGALKRMMEIQKEIGSLQKEYDSLKGKL